MRCLFIFLLALNLLYSVTQNVYTYEKGLPPANTKSTRVTLFGDIYNGNTFSYLNNTRIRIEGPVTAQVIAHTNYSIELPPGEYTISAYYITRGNLEYYTKEKIRINQSLVRFDLVLSPPQDSTLKQNGSTNENQTNVKNSYQTGTITIETLFFLGSLLLLLTSGAVLYLFLRKKQERIAKTEQKIIPRIEKRFQEQDTLRETSRKILRIIQAHGGNIPQKELKEIMHLSDSGISLELTELEALEYVERFKHGRENVVRLVKLPT